MTGLIIKRSVTREPWKYIKFIICLICCSMLITSVIIYKDSDDYGTKERLRSVTGGVDIIVSDVAPKYAELFKIKGTTYRYDDKTVYLSLTGSSDIDSVLREVRRTIIDNGLDYKVENHYYLNRPSTPGLVVFLYSVIVVLLIFSAITMSYMYKAFLSTREADIKKLYMLGASKKQVGKILKYELLILFSISTLAGILIANLVMSIIINNNLSLNNANFATIRYHYSFSGFLLTLALTAFLCLVTYEIGMLSLNKEKDDTKRKRSFILGGPAYYNMPLTFFYTLRSFLREKKHNLTCFFIAFPIIALSLFVSVYMSMYSPEESAAKEADLVFYRDIKSEFLYSAEDIERMLENIEGIEDISFYIYRSDYILTLQNKSVGIITSYHDETGRERTPAEFGVVGDEQFFAYLEKQSDAEGLCIVPDGYGLSVGDTVCLDNGDNKIELTVGGLFDFLQNKNTVKMFPVYVLTETYEALTGDVAVPYTVSVDLAEDAEGRADEVIDIMTADGAYTARDNIKNREDYIKLYNGITTVTVVFAVLITFIESILLYSYISMHIQSKRKDIIIMNSIGCSGKRAVKIYAAENLLRFSLISVSAIVIGIAASSVLAYFVKKPIVLGAATLLPCVLVIVTLAASCVISSLCTVGNILKTER